MRSTAPSCGPPAAAEPEGAFAAQRPEGDAVLVGRPFAPIGMGEFIRASFRGFRAAGVPVRVHDLFESEAGRDRDLEREIGAHLTRSFSARLNIFYINGMEIAEVLRSLGPALPPTSYNVIWPMWELARYPADWAAEMTRFDEVWAATRFTEASLRAAGIKQVVSMPLGIEPRLSRFLGRRHFGLPEGAFLFLFMFDFLSFVERKNPAAVLEAFRRLTRLRPSADVRLVIKLNNAGKGRRDARDFAGELAHASDRVIVIDRVMTDNEVKNLIRGCDCFLSLHRSEGFGFPLGEAMYFGKPVIATGYSGNLEFMNETNACLVPFRLVPVRPGSYPRTDRQVWADPDVDAAVRGMVRVIDDPAYRRSLGESASRHLRTHFSYLAAGLCYRARLAEVLPT